jgi:hypothetical protein
MRKTSRREFIGQTCKMLASAMVGLTGPMCFAAATTESGDQQRADASTIEAWMNDWMETKALEGTLKLSRFVEPVYFLLESIAWKPRAGQTGYKRVVAPKGFVTDFASIPRVFWSLLRPDGEYAYAAILHDYMYWTQSVPKKTADDILRMGMQDLEVTPATVALIYEGVAKFGETAWTNNAKLKANGEKRLLRKFPSDPTTRWRDWKKRPDVFR